MLKAYHLWSFYFRSRESSSYACSFSLQGSLPLLWLSFWWREKREAIRGNHRAHWNNGPWQVLSYPVWLTVAHSHPQKLQNKTDNKKIEGVRFDAVKGNTASKCKLCKHFYRMFKLAIRMAFTAPWHKMSLMHLKRLKGGWPIPMTWPLLYQEPYFRL